MQLRLIGIRDSEWHSERIFLTSNLPLPRDFIHVLTASNLPFASSPAQALFAPAKAIGGHFAYGAIGNALSGRAMAAIALCAGCGGALIGRVFVMLVAALKRPMWPQASPPLLILPWPPISLSLSFSLSLGPIIILGLPLILRIILPWPSDTAGTCRGDV